MWGIASKTGNVHDYACQYRINKMANMTMHANMRVIINEFTIWKYT